MLLQGFFYLADFTALRGAERCGARGDKTHDQFVYSEPVGHCEGAEQQVELGDQQCDEHLDCSRDIHVHRCQRVGQREPDGDDDLYPEGRE